MVSFSQPTFSGTIRENIDPDNEYSDEDILQALKEVQPTSAKWKRASRLSTFASETSGTSLRPANEEMPQDDAPSAILDSVVAPSGLNFSVSEQYVSNFTTLEMCTSIDGIF